MNWDIQDLIFMCRGIYAAACIRHYISCKNIIILYYTETVIKIFKTYTEMRIRCYIGIISRFLADSYDMNKREYGLHVFIESFFSFFIQWYTGKLLEKYKGKLRSVFNRILSKYGRIRSKKKPYSRWFYVV